ncbi:hypothetical protein H2248_005447 [Termitomyces sp. 'cryptogamus']|nr:hypothetical protein H2248_005447 [Termitomyces sp. 'cryptogamus']
MLRSHSTAWASVTTPNKTSVVLGSPPALVISSWRFLKMSLRTSHFLSVFLVRGPSAHAPTNCRFLIRKLYHLTNQYILRSPVDSPKAFAALSQVIENVGTGAYTGAISTLSQQYITGSASILGTEARQASLVASYVNGVEGWGNPFNIPLTKNQAFTLAAPFIVSCPRSNPPLPGVHANPPLTFPSNANPGETVSVYFNSNIDRRLFAVFLFGLEQIVVPINNGRVTIPQGLAGQVYCLISTSPNGVTDGTTVAGPAVLQFQHTLTGQYIENR